MDETFRLKVMSVRLASVHTKALDKLAKLWGVSRSDALRKAIMQAHGTCGQQTAKRRKSK